MPASRSVVVGRIGAAHGVKGEVRLKSYTEVPSDIIGYAPLTAADGRSFEVVQARPASGAGADMLVVRFKGIDDREAAVGLAGTELSVPRDRLPGVQTDEFYHADLIGLAAVSVSGEPLGKVIAVANHGAGDLIEIMLAKGPPLLLPFTRAAVPEVDIAGGRVVVDPPVELPDGDDEESAP